MSDTTSDLTVRPALPGDVPPLEGWPVTEPVAAVDAAALRDEMATRHYRLEWSWIAERAGRPVGRALWWGSPDADRASTLDCLLAAGDDKQREVTGTALIVAGLAAFGPGSPLEFNVDVAPDWTDDPVAVAAVRWRHRAARSGGFTRTTERVSFTRTDADPRPDRSTRLRFSPGPDQEFRQLFGQVAVDSLDAHTTDMVAREGIEALADDDLEFYLSLPGRRDAWQVARTTDGTTVGFIIPTRNAYDASISYLGVLPEQRGHGYVHDLLAEMVHLHHDDAQPRIVGTTDAANAPMRAAFDRAGFAVTRVRIVHAQ